MAQIKKKIAGQVSGPKKVSTTSSSSTPVASKKKKKAPTGKAKAEVRHVSAELVDSDTQPQKLINPENSDRQFEPEIDSEFPSEIEIDSDAGFDPDVDAEIDSDSDSEIESDSVREPKPKKVRGKTNRKSRLPATLSSRAVVTTQDPISAYMQELRKYPLLTREQELELAKRYYETKDPAAAQALVTANLRFVVKVAAEYSKFGSRLIDLVQEGNMGLMHAVRDFNPYKNVRLITYAVWWIRGYIQEYLMKQYSMVKIGTTQNQKKLFYRLQKEKDNLDALGENPDVVMIGSKLGIPPEEVREMSQRLRGRDVSLSQTFDDDSKSTMLDFQKTDQEPPDELLARAEELKILRERIEKLRPQLSERELILLDERLLADEPLTLQEIGDKHKITREAVRQMESRLLDKIRKSLQ